MTFKNTNTPDRTIIEDMNVNHLHGSRTMFLVGNYLIIQVIIQGVNIACIPN